MLLQLGFASGLDLATFERPALALAVGALSANQPLGVLLSMAEPLLFAAMMVLVVSSLLEHRHGLAATFLASGVIGAVALHLPSTEHRATSDGPEWLRMLRGCALLSKPARAPIRLLTWTIENPQKLDKPIALFLISGFLGMLSLTPLPTMPLLIAALLTAGIGWGMRRVAVGEQRAEVVEPGCAEDRVASRV